MDRSRTVSDSRIEIYENKPKRCSCNKTIIVSIALVAIAAISAAYANRESIIPFIDKHLVNTKDPIAVLVTEIILGTMGVGVLLGLIIARICCATKQRFKPSTPGERPGSSTPSLQPDSEETKSNPEWELLRKQNASLLAELATSRAQKGKKGADQTSSTTPSRQEEGEGKNNTELDELRRHNQAMSEYIMQLELNNARRTASEGKKPSITSKPSSRGSDDMEALRQELQQAKEALEDERKDKERVRQQLTAGSGNYTAEGGRRNASLGIPQSQRVDDPDYS